MLLVTSNKARQLLYISYIGSVRLEDFQSSREDLTAQLKELSPGFRMLVDISPMASMGLDCAPALGQEIWRIVVDEQYCIGTVGQSPAGGRGLGGAGHPRAEPGHRHEYHDGFSLPASSPGGHVP